MKSVVVNLPATTPVMRGVTLHTQPYTLARPVRPSSPRLLPAPTATVALVEATSPGLDQAVAEALALGREEGRLLAAEQFARHQQVEIDAERRDAVEQGRQEGIRAGEAHAQRQLGEAQVVLTDRMRQELLDRVGQLDALLASLSNQMADAMMLAEEDLVALAHEAACALVGAAAVTRDGVSSQVERLLARHGHKKALAIHLHPDDLAVLKQASPAAAHNGQWSWVADAQLEAGGVLLRSPEGSLDARLETQMQALIDVLVAKRGMLESRTRVASTPRPD